MLHVEPRRPQAPTSVLSAVDPYPGSRAAAEPLRTGIRIGECLAWRRKAVYPGLELAGNAEIVHGRAKHDDIGRQELIENRIYCFQFLMRHGGFTLGALFCSRRVKLKSQQRFAVVGYRYGGNISIADLYAGSRRLERLDNACCKLPADRTS